MEKKYLGTLIIKAVGAPVTLSGYGGWELDPMVPLDLVGLCGCFETATKACFGGPNFEISRLIEEGAIIITQATKPEPFFGC